VAHDVVQMVESSIWASNYCKHEGRADMQAEPIPMTEAPVRSGEQRNGADEPQVMVLASGISLRLWRLYAYFWLVCLLFPILTLTQMHPTPVQWLIALAGLLIFVISYVWVMWPHPLSGVGRVRAQSRIALLLFAMLTALVLALSLAYGSAFLWLFVGVSAIAGVALPPRRAFWVVMILTLLTLFTGVGVSGGITQTDWLHIIPLVLLVRGLGLDIAGFARLASALSELHAARRELARLAVIEERMRMARDLHDLLGHNLSLITLKSELAGRLLETAPARASAEIQEVERMARQTLREVREAVAGYRQPELVSELDGARQLLSAAGIECQIEHSAGALHPAQDAVLAWAVREGVTNVIRHSRARHCTISLVCDAGSIRAEIINDGERRRDQSVTPSESGSGLAGLAERVRACGGAVEAGPLQTANSGGFRLWVELPLPEQLESGKEQRG
jgi:two-component system sensor histidine kinase DesK